MKEIAGLLFLSVLLGIGTGACGDETLSAGTPQTLPLEPDVDGTKTDDLKAEFLVKLLPFFTFPEKFCAAASRPLTVVVLGTDPFGAKLDGAMGRICSGEREVRITRISSVRSMCEFNEPVDVAFIALTDKDQICQALELFSKCGTLTVGDTDGFCRAGGMVGLRKSSNRIRFAINRQAAEQAGFKISSKLLALAVLVETDSRGEE